MTIVAAELNHLWEAAAPESKTGEFIHEPSPALEAARIEERVLSIYRVAALSAKAAPDDEVAGIWLAMAKVCDEACAMLSELKRDRPQCSLSHDRILDVRNRCQRLADWHS